MKYLLQKDKKKRNSYRDSENLINSLKFLSKFDKGMPTKHRDQAVKKNSSLQDAQFGKCYAKNRCVFTNRSRSVYRMGRISRIKFRSYSLFGYLTGVQKSSW